MESNRQQYDDLNIGIFHPRDAEGIAGLFRSVYGEEYPVRLVYNPAELIAAFEREENIPIVARTADGRIVAHEALYRTSPNLKVYEAGQGLVALEWRGSGVNGQINDYILNTLVPRLNMDAVFGEAVCNHVYMQKGWGRFGTMETGIEVDLMPHEAYVAEGSATGRVATLFMFRNYRKQEQAVYLPGIYRDHLQFIYSTFPAIPKLKAGRAALPLEPSKIETQVFDFAKVARMTIKNPGADFEAAVADQQKVLVSQGMVVLQAWLNLSWPFIDKVIDILRKHGYFFGGLLPAWFETDGLLMQKVLQRPNWEGINLYSDRAKEILGFIKADWSRVGSPSSPLRRSL
ncbi:MAG: hypothetical protein A4E65_02797 [Syntrophorhabdus sp. PtaU1.Bin153]|nr:MAG: hypothetical protein A4E65_02797 [Syntrophorhabdus sp. PtaU1.Bin153]